MEKVLFDPRTGELIVVHSDPEDDPSLVVADLIADGGFFGGYMISSIGHLPIEDNMAFYIFIIGAEIWKSSMNETILSNFENIARQIGSNASIVKGLEEPFWSEEVIEKYFGKDHRTIWDSCPALLITDSHPKKLDEKSLRLLIPLREIPDNFFDIDDFFNSLVRLVKYKEFSFFNKFENNERRANTNRPSSNFWGIEKNLDRLTSHLLGEVSKIMVDNPRIINVKDGNYIESNTGTYIQRDFVNMSQDLAQAATQIQSLLEQLQNRGVSVDEAQVNVAEEMANQAEQNPTMKEKLLKWGQSLGDATVSDVVKGAVKLAIRSAGVPLP